jgi:hypothetical protein
MPRNTGWSRRTGNLKGFACNAYPVGGVASRSVVVAARHDPLTRLAPLATLSPKGGEGLLYLTFSPRPLWGRSACPTSFAGHPGCIRARLEPTVPHEARHVTTPKCKCLVILRLFSFVFSYLTALPEFRKSALCFLIPNGIAPRISNVHVDVLPIHPSLFKSGNSGHRSIHGLARGLPLSVA